MAFLIATPVIAILTEKMSELERGNAERRNENAGLSRDGATLRRQLEYLSTKVAEAQDGKEAAEAAGRDADVRAERLQAELRELRDAASRLRAFCGELGARCSRLDGENGSAREALDAEKAAARGLAAEVEALERSGEEKDGEIERLRAEVGEEEGKVGALAEETERLRLTVAEMQRRGKNKCAGMCAAF